MEQFIVVEDDLIVNIVVAENKASIPTRPGQTVYPQPDNVGVGWTWNGTEWVPPELEELESIDGILKKLEQIETIIETIMLGQLDIE